jgi:hypothetical protein
MYASPKDARSSSAGPENMEYAMPQYNALKKASFRNGGRK